MVKPLSGNLPVPCRIDSGDEFGFGPNLDLTLKEAGTPTHCHPVNHSQGISCHAATLMQRDKDVCDIMYIIWPY